MGPFANCLQDWGMIAQYAMPCSPEENCMVELHSYGYGEEHDE